MYRQRFTVAHEAAHAIFDGDSISIDFEKPNAPRNSKWTTEELIEIRAERFASCFLIPPSIAEHMRNFEWTEDLARQWASKLKVSTRALAKSLKDAGLRDDTALSIIRESKLSKDQKKDQELPPDLSPNTMMRRKKMLERGLSDYYVNLCFRALSEGIISVGRLSEVLLVHTSELDEVASVFSRGVRNGA
ncbi:hypothetical protein D3C86_1557410 [compost metagenome]